MSIDLVIARYKENLSWLKDIPTNFNTFIYNKDDSIPPTRVFTRNGWINKGAIPSPINAPQNASIINLPNIGREADTYLTHIINNYDNLADITIFCQGSPFDHSPDILKLFQYNNLFLDVQPLTDRYLDIANMPPASILKNNTEDFINDARVAVHPISFFNFQTLNYHDQGSYNVLEPFMKHFNIPNGTNIVEYTMKINGFTMSSKVPSIGYFCFAAIFAVKKANILKHPIEAYKNLKNMNANGNLLCASAIERMWLYLFGYNKPLTISNNEDDDDFLKIPSVLTTSQHFNLHKEFTEPSVNVEALKEPFVNIEALKEPLVNVEALKEPSVDVEVLKELSVNIEDTSVNVEKLKEPSVNVEALKEPSVNVEALKEPSVDVEVLKEPSVDVEVLKELSVNIEDTSVDVEALTEPSLNVEKLKESSVDVEALKEPSVYVEALKEPSVDVEALTEPSVNVEALTEPSVDVEALTEPSVDVEALTESSVNVEALKESEDEYKSIIDSLSILKSLNLHE
jgi:hypothetical protein